MSSASRPTNGAPADPSLRLALSAGPTTDEPSPRAWNSNRPRASSLVVVSASLVLAAWAGSAQAQVARVFVSVNGNDLNPLLPILTGAVYLLDGHAHYGPLGEVVDGELLSHLYGTRMTVVRTAQGDLFTRSGGE